MADAKAPPAHAPQPLLLKILRRLLSDPANPKLRRLKLEKLRGRLSAVSLLALRNCGFKEESGLLCLPAGPENDDSARRLLESLENIVLNTKRKQLTKTISTASHEEIEQTKQTVIESLALAEREMEIYSKIDNTSLSSSFSTTQASSSLAQGSPLTVSKMFEATNPSLWSAGKVLAQILEAALDKQPAAFRIPTSGAGGVASPLARANGCPGALEVLRASGFHFTPSVIILRENANLDALRMNLAELCRRLARDMEEVAKARASAVDRLAAMALKKKKKKKNRDGTETSAAGSANDSKAVREELMLKLSQVDKFQSILAQKRQHHGAAYRMRWTVANWKLRSMNEKSTALEYPGVIVDPSGRKWRGYIRKQDSSEEDASRSDYAVALFLECLSTSVLKRNPAAVTMRASILHAHTKEPICVPGTAIALTLTPRVFTNVNTAWGFDRLFSGGGNSRLAGLGAWDPEIDKLSIQIDFTVKDSPIPLEEEKEEMDEAKEPCEEKSVSQLGQTEQGNLEMKDRQPASEVGESEVAKGS